MLARPIIAIIGDGLVREHHPLYLLARAVGQEVVDRGFRVLTGGLGGVMEAASRGAHESSQYQSGDVIGMLPGSDPESANPYVDIALPTSIGHGRNYLVSQADAVIMIGGGAGTLTEAAYAWILRRLLIAMRVEGWSGKLADTRIDDRVRVPDVPEDCVFGASTATEVGDVLQRYLPTYLRAIRRG